MAKRIEKVHHAVHIAGNRVEFELQANRIKGGPVDPDPYAYPPAHIPIRGELDNACWRTKSLRARLNEADGHMQTIVRESSKMVNNGMSRVVDYTIDRAKEAFGWDSEDDRERALEKEKGRERRRRGRERRGRRRSPSYPPPTNEEMGWGDIAREAEGVAHKEQLA